MKKAIALKTFGIIMLSVIFLSSCVKEENKSEILGQKGSLKTDENSYLPIYMGQNTLIGEAFITIENDQILVSVDLDEGYMPSEAHLYAGEEPPPSSAPGQFPYHWYEGDPFPIVFAVDISDWYECTAFDWYFALHLAVGTETAWILPEGGIYWYNKNGKKNGWGQYFLHSFAACQRPER